MGRKALERKVGHRLGAWRRGRNGTERSVVDGWALQRRALEKPKRMGKLRIAMDGTGVAELVWRVGVTR